jgi:streptomycin 6-kinase
MCVPPSIPEGLVRSTIEMRGEAGAGWLEGLPALVSDLERRWSVEVGRPYPGLWVNWVAPATGVGGEPVVLKLSFPGDLVFRTEAEALRLFDGRAAAGLLRLDLDRGAMLIERCEPGAPLSSVEDDAAATAIAAGVMKRLWRPAPAAGHPFPLVSDWAQGLARLRRRFGGGTGPMPAALVEEAESLFAWLIPSQGEPVLLHGDLHHGNILASGREPWLAIDPKGVVGEPAYDTGALLRNPAEALRMPHSGKVLERRLDVLCEELGLDRARVRGWGLSQAVLAAYWNLEDAGRVWEQGLAFAEILSAVRP